MLDLDTLADRRAKTLNQGPEAWKAAVWGAEFQKLSQSMSDGEVEALISWCPTVKHLKKVVKFLDGKCSESGFSPFTVLTKVAEGDGLKPGEWIQKKLEGV